jgi:hypothetical protein
MKNQYPVETLNIEVKEYIVIILTSIKSDIDSDMDYSNIDITELTMKYFFHESLERICDYLVFGDESVLQDGDYDLYNKTCAMALSTYPKENE